MTSYDRIRDLGSILSNILIKYQDSSLGVVTGYGLNGGGGGGGVGGGGGGGGVMRSSSSPRYPDQLWVLSSPLCNGYGGIFSHG
jgi:hypothetical protein